MSDLVERLRGQIPLELGDRLKCADEIQRLRTENEALKVNLESSSRRAEYWKAEHNAANAVNEALNSARSIAAEQAEDPGLWFMATTAPEAYLQQALRRLTSAVEAEPSAIDAAMKDSAGDGNET